MTDMLTKTEKIDADTLEGLIDAHALAVYERIKDGESPEDFSELPAIVQFQLREAALVIANISAEVIKEQGLIKPTTLDTVAELQKLGKGSKVLSIRSRDLYWSEGDGKWSGSSGLSYLTNEDLWLFEAPLLLVVEEKK